MPFTMTKKPFCIIHGKKDPWQRGCCGAKHIAWNVTIVNSDLHKLHGYTKERKCGWFNFKKLYHKCNKQKMTNKYIFVYLDFIIWNDSKKKSLKIDLEQIL